MVEDSRRALIASLLPALFAASAASAQAPQPNRILRLDNQRLILTETSFPPGVPVKGKPRLTDQMVLFLDDCRYEHADPATGTKSVRSRKSGDYIWYDRGGESPVLTNLGPKTYRTLLVELK